MAAPLLTGTLLTGCQSSAHKETSARKNVQEAKQELKDVQKEANTEAQKLANAKEWETFKREFNHDMDELGKALKDLTVDNKN